MSWQRAGRWRRFYGAKFAGHNESALEALKLNTLFFPSGFNTYDSYGEALAKLDKVKETIIMYKKSLLLNPGSEGGKSLVHSDYAADIAIP